MIYLMSNCGGESSDELSKESIITVSLEDNVDDGDCVKEEKFKPLLTAFSTDLEALKRLSWLGIPRKYRSTVWKLLLVLCFVYQSQGIYSFTDSKT
jgi:hypothetical protein